jgi:hypothetical protein
MKPTKQSASKARVHPKLPVAPVKAGATTAHRPSGRATVAALSGVAQVKRPGHSSAPVRENNQPVAPPVYHPQTVPRVLQTKPSQSATVAKSSITSRALPRVTSLTVQMSKGSHKKQKLFVKLTYQYKDSGGTKKYGTYEAELDKGRAAHPDEKQEVQGCDDAIEAVKAKLPAGYTNFESDCKNFTRKG